MSDTQFDQNAWFARIGYSGSVTPTLETLNRLILAHSHTMHSCSRELWIGQPAIPTARGAPPTIETRRADFSVSVNFC
jgi:hypothetical protein